MIVWCGVGTYGRYFVVEGVREIAICSFGRHVKFLVLMPEYPPLLRACTDNLGYLWKPWRCGDSECSGPIWQKYLNIRVFETMLYHGIFYFNRTFACLEIKYSKS
jgi:hypothetical protein